MAGALIQLTCLVLAFMVVSTPMAADAALACNTVQGALAPCIGYLTNGGPLPWPCCSGVQRLNGLARTTADRQQACRCLQNAARSIPSIKPNLAAGLPGACRVNIPYTIGLSTNCANVK